ncbi:STAS domain-containing protein [Cryptosporangium phraense]|uniref:STAS domain-containing protein n=1 Tax=Cryptosporangium phraense TaxID=2593070 RepID=A0A545AE61_9ACTN|nr:STAS domain-containing protein [Cryptosporangium phraense]TQS39593.1 STAS domain-containing protein [Cryptosporangium phraense]
MVDTLYGPGVLDVARVVEEDQCYALFLLTGDIDEIVAPRLLEQLVTAARLPEIDLVIVDLIRVDFCGASGANCLDAAHRAAGRHGAELVLTRPSQFVRRVLQITGLAHLVADE